MQRLGSFTWAVAALALSGCYATSTNGLKERGPTFQRTSQRSVIQIVECVNAKWEVSEKGAGRYSPREHGALLVHGLPTMAIDIEDMGEERRVTFYRIGTLIASVDERRSNEVSSCL